MAWVFSTPPAETDPLRQAVRNSYRIAEDEAVARILAVAETSPASQARIEATARRLVIEARGRRHGKGGIDAFLNEFALSSREGIALMCLAEALLRVPDAQTIDLLIRDKLAPADWTRHLGHSNSVFVNASTWALMLTGKLLHDDPAEQDWTAVLRRLLARTGEPVLRQAVTAAMRILGHQFVMGRSIDDALMRAAPAEAQGYRFSYDMLGEAARTAADAMRYAEHYRRAIAAIGAQVRGRDLHQVPGISIKLSALHPRYEESQRERALAALMPILLALARQAKEAGIGIAVDAEEADRLDLSLDLIEALAGDPELAGWNGLGLAVQAYQKRALPLIDWLAVLARRCKRRFMIRLVKGAYWDTEIKRSQERGLAFFPVFTRKMATDTSYLACARRIWASRDAFYPQFATHNAHTVAAIMELAGDERDFEFQRLHGMGEALYDRLVGSDPAQFACRVYAPVGGHEDLLAYLVRRLLENGANTSFVNRLVDEAAPVELLVADPVAKLKALAVKPHPGIKLPADLYGKERRNARGIDLSDRLRLAELSNALGEAERTVWSAAPIIGGQEQARAARVVSDPSDRRRAVGTVSDANDAHIEAALALAAAAAPGWDATPAEERAQYLERAADLLEARMTDFMALVVREAGRTILDALAELREAVDHCRYHAARARGEFAVPIELPGPTGERNLLALHGRGVFACISPWNFPLAIFLGQAAAALAAGNAVIAKPAEQTPLVAAAAIRLLHEAGVPADIIQLLPGDGPSVGAKLVADPRVAGVAFTGSTETARAINQALAQRPGPIVPFIAETGGQNALIADFDRVARAARRRRSRLRLR